MNKIVKIDNAEDAPAVSVTSMMGFIQRAAADPTFDVLKLEKMMAMAERMEARQAERAFDVAMANAQEAAEPVRTDANNPQTHSKYATYAALDRALRPTYTQHGFSISYDTGDAPAPDLLRVLAYVAHRAGHRKTYKIDMPADGKGAKGGDVMTKTHATGAAFSYGQRYLLKGIFNIVVSNDDDGNGAGSQQGPVTDDQVGHIAELMERFNVDVPRFCKFMGVAAVKDIPASQYRKAIQALNAKGLKK